MRKSLHRLLPVAFFAALLDPSYAASAAVEINAPLPEILRERIAGMLRIVRPKDAAAALDATRILGSTWQDGGPLIMRVETDCRDGLCMTVIARVTEDAVLPDLILNAGKVFSGADSGAELWGSDRPIWWLTFEGRDGARLLAAERGGRWIVEAGGPFDPNKRVVPELRTPLPPVPFEVFRREIDSAR